jgi:hypothetical protein
MTNASRSKIRRLVACATRATTRLLCTTLFLSAVPVAAQRSPTGHFSIRRGPHDDRTQLTISDRDDGFRGGMTSFGVEPNVLRGLSDDQLDESYSGPLHFTLTRDAGTITFDGKAAGGEGGGSYSFAGNPAYAASLATRGYGRPDESQQFQLALHDVGYPVLDELKSQGYPTAPIAELVKMGMHGVDLDYVHAMGALRYRFGSIPVLTRFRDHGVDADFVDELAKTGYSSIPAEELMTLKDHGVSGDFISDLSRAGFAKLTTEELLRARDHGVTASFINGFKRAGYDAFSIADFVRLRDHGVTASFAKRMRERSSSTPTAEDLTTAMDHGDGE